MLKRQRPVTPPPSFLGDPPLFLPDAPSRPPHSADSPQPPSKRQRTRPPPLDGPLRGWFQSEATEPHSESDGEEDWIEDAHDVVTPSLSSSTADQYKDTNSLLRELHAFNQHRLLFVHSPRDLRLNPVHRTHVHDGGRSAAWTDESPYRPTLSQLDHGKPACRSRCAQSAGEKGFVEEVECVRQRYEDANRLLGSLFLSRRREVQGTASPEPDSDDRHP